MSNVEQFQRFEQLVEDTDLRVRLGVKAGNNWIDRSQLVPNNRHGDDKSVQEYVVKIEQPSTRRYSLITRDDEIWVEKWQRFVFPVEQQLEAEGQRSVSDDVNIVVDVSGTNRRTVPDTMPWQGKKMMVITSESLQWDTGFPSVDADRVAGLDQEKERLNQFLADSDEDWGLAEPTGVILEGPPGTGKTELVMEVCQERYGDIPVMISGPEILSKWVGESERLLRKKFEEAWATEHKVLYIDELDAIAQSRGDVSESHTAQIVAQLLVLLDGVSSKEQAQDADRSLKVIASTNLSHVVDEALRRPGRLGNRPIRFSHPNQNERRAILHHYLEGIHTSTDGQLSTALQEFVRGNRLTALDEIVEATDGFTGADLEDLIQASVRELRDTDRHQLDLDTIGNILDDGGFRQRQVFTEKILSVEEVDQRTDNLERYDPSKPGLYGVTEDTALKEAQNYFTAVQDGDAEQELIFTLRTVAPRDIMTSDVVRAKEKLVQAFQHRENERIAVHLQDADLLLQAREGSDLVDRLLGVIHEQFLQWQEENVLLVPEAVTEDLIAFESQ